MIRTIVRFLALCVICIQSAHAALDIELTKGIDSAVPIAVVPFDWQSTNAKPPVDVSRVVSNDLSHSGQFNVLATKLFSQAPHTAKEVDIDYWRKKNVESVLVGKVQPMSDGQYKVSFALVSLYKDIKATEGGDKTSNDAIIEQSIVSDPKDMRQLAHHISDLIYTALTGEKGIFSTRIAYVLVKRNEADDTTRYQLEIADMDGHNPHAIMRSDEPIMSPAWSPDGTKLAYVSFENKRPRVYVSDVTTGQRQQLTSFPGINSAPAWSPDGKQLALALSKGKNPNIYILDVSSNRLKQVTKGSAINTEPKWAPDGKSVIFTSDRGGTPQIYRLYLPKGEMERLTFDGRYNTTASFSPDGKNLVFLHRTDNGYAIAVMDMNYGTLRVLTNTGFEESPSFAPNGRMLVYASQHGGRGILGMVSTDGRVKLRLPDQKGSVQEPVWSPYIN